MKIKFITSIYSDLHGTEFGGRPNRGSHYRYSLLSLLKMTDADFLCYTSDREINDLIKFFYEDNGISPDKLKLEIFDIGNTKFKDLISQHKKIEEVIHSDRCVEVQYSKFHWWWNEDKSYDYYYWIDAGLSHCGLIPDKYLTEVGPMRCYYESNLLQNKWCEQKNESLLRSCEVKNVFCLLYVYWCMNSSGSLAGTILALIFICIFGDHNCLQLELRFCCS
jgi:hypothetical protein